MHFPRSSTNSDIQPNYLIFLPLAGPELPFRACLKTKQLSEELSQNMLMKVGILSCYAIHMEEWLEVMLWTASTLPRGKHKERLEV
jgi:hypothetical protein